MSKKDDNELNKKTLALKEFREQRIQELKDIRQKLQKEDKWEEKAGPVKDMLRDKNVAKKSDFTKKKGEEGEKKTGVSAGYIADEKESGNTFILKKFYKSPRKGQQEVDRRDAVQELFGSDLYRLLLLYDRAPKEELVIPKIKEYFLDKMEKKFLRNNEELVITDEIKSKLLDKAEKKFLRENQFLYVRSKFFENAVGLGEFTGGKDTNLDTNNPKLKFIQGFEKAIAACHMLGEGDYHAGNLMVQTMVKGSDGEYRLPFNQKEVVSIENEINNKKRDKDDIKYTVTKIDHGRSFMRFHHDFASMIKATASDLEACHYSEAIDKGNLNFNVKKYSEALKQMVSQFDDNQVEVIVEQKIAELKKAGFNPKGLSSVAMFGAEIKNIKIKDFDDLKVIYTEVIETNLKNMKKISKDVEIVAKFSNVSERFKNGKWIEEFNYSSEKDPIAYAIVNHIKIEGKEALEWAQDNNRVTDKLVELAKHKSRDGKKETATISKSMLSIVEEFAYNNLGDKEISKSKVEGLYNNILRELSNGKFIEDREIKKLKAGYPSQFDKEVDQTLELLKNNKIDLNIKDKICYGVAKFCKNLGCTKIAESFMKNITQEGLGKIQTAELIASDSIKNISNKLAKTPHLIAQVSNKTKRAVLAKAKPAKGGKGEIRR